jgi:hypothetical protein
VSILKEKLLDVLDGEELPDLVMAASFLLIALAVVFFMGLAGVGILIDILTPDVCVPQGPAL